MKFEIHFAPLRGNPRKYDDSQELRSDSPRAAHTAYYAILDAVKKDITRVGCYLAVLDGDDVVDAFDMSEYGPEILITFLDNVSTYRTPPVSVPHTQSTTQE